MNFPSIDIQGSILSADLLSKIRGEQATFQQGKDFNPDFTNIKLKDEISLAWQDAKGQWTIFKSKLARLKEGETGTTETRNFWISPILTNLGYNLNYNRQSEELNGKSFPIGYRDSNRDNFPVYVGGYHESLDKRPENKQLRVSPHAMLQEYLNYSEHLYGLVTNGRQLRLLRDASRITRLSYVEFNLEKIMEEDLYSDFVIFYRVLHASRMPAKMDGGAESIIEKYHQEGLEAGSTIRSKLGGAVKGAILTLANGFINHPNNTQLRAAFEEGRLNSDDYYHHLLRVVYRLLFLFVIEERNLVYADNKTPEAKRFAEIYFKYYSLLRLRKLAAKLPPPDAERHYDLWMSLVNTFALFEQKEMGERLGIMALQGDLFGYDAIAGNHYDLHKCTLSNAVLLQIIQSLGYFDNDNKTSKIAVNYGGLDVEEFGSVYEGLLELKLDFRKIEGSENYAVNWKKLTTGREFQSHYSPEELVQPLIKHSLDYLIEERIKNPKQYLTNEQILKASPLGGGLVGAALLNLKVCDISSGSGHILLSAARRIALALAQAQTGEDQPNPQAIRRAMKEVIRNCIYGVDKNPLAVELCKIALWLEAYNPGEPLNFLDHHIKCGDSIVGLAHRDELENGIADEAFKTLPGDDKEIAAAFLKKNRQERRIREDKQAAAQLKITETIENTVQESMAEYSTFNRLPEHTPDEIAAKARAYNKFINGKGYSFLKAMADTQVAQFFIPKTTGNKHRLITDSDYQAILKGFAGWQNQQTAYAVVVAQEKRFFHWFLEFPEVFQNGGFDSILGNPPYLGGSKLSSNYGLPFIEFLHYSYSPAAGRCDLAAYFLRRNYKIINMPGFVSLITTNSINQGETRDGGLEYIQSNNGIICFAQKSIKWPGVAAVEVTLISITNNISHKNIFLDGKKVEFINSFLTSDSFLSKPYSILANKNLAFQGTNIYGKGFIIKADEFKSLINTDIKNLEVISTYLTGDEINNNPDHRSERYVINFWNRSLKESSVFSDCLNIVLSKVKPERDLVNRERYRNVWWQFGEKCENLYRSTKHLNLVITLSRVTKYINPVIVNNSGIFSDATIVFSENSFQFLALLNCTFHYEWCNFSSSALASTIRYNPSDCILTYPLPHNYNQNNKLRTIGEKYYKHRCELLLILQLGLTKTYNAFHAREITASLANPSASADLTALNMDKKSIEKKYGKEVWNLWNHLQKMEHPDKGGTSCTFEEAVAGIIHLRELHVEMDNAVLEAYGWWEAQVSPPASTAVSPPAKGEYPKGEGVREGVSLHHDFYEVDYLPENDRIRYTIHPDARKEILKRLLELNHKIHEEEVKAGLWDKKKTVKYEIKPSRNTAEEPGEGYGQGKLF